MNKYVVGCNRTDPLNFACYLGGSKSLNCWVDLQDARFFDNEEEAVNLAEFLNEYRDMDMTSVYAIALNESFVHKFLLDSNNNGV